MRGSRKTVRIKDKIRTLEWPRPDDLNWLIGAVHKQIWHANVFPTGLDKRIMNQVTMMDDRELAEMKESKFYPKKSLNPTPAICTIKPEKVGSSLPAMIPVAQEQWQGDGPLHSNLDLRGVDHSRETRRTRDKDMQGPATACRTSAEFRVYAVIFSSGPTDRLWKQRSWTGFQRWLFLQKVWR